MCLIRNLVVIYIVFLFIYHLYVGVGDNVGVGEVAVGDMLEWGISRSLGNVGVGEVFCFCTREVCIKMAKSNNIFKLSNTAVSLYFSFT